MPAPPCCLTRSDVNIKGKIDIPKVSILSKISYENDFFFFFFVMNVGSTVPRTPSESAPGSIPVSILHKSIAGRYRPVRVANGPIAAALLDLRTQ